MIIHRPIFIYLEVFVLLKHILSFWCSELSHVYPNTYQYSITRRRHEGEETKLFEERRKFLLLTSLLLCVYYIFIVVSDNNPCIAWLWWWWYWLCLAVTTVHDRIWPAPSLLGSHCHIMINTRTIFFFLSEKISVPITHLAEIIGVSVLWEDTMSHLLVNPSLPLSGI